MGFYGTCDPGIYEGLQRFVEVIDSAPPCVIALIRHQAQCLHDPSTRTLDARARGSEGGNNDF